MENILTLQQLKDLPPGIFASGIVPNSPEGIYMTTHREGDNLIWVASRGRIHDWAIYVTWAESGREFALSNGDKVRGEVNIKKLVPCDGEAFEMYRY